MRVVASVCFTLALFVLCTDSAADHTSTRTGSVSSTCGAWRCGFNAAEINGQSLQSLHLQGQPNEDGVKITGFIPPALGLLGGYTTLTVENDEFVAKNLLGSKIKGAQLVTGIILLELPGGLPLPVTILGYEQVPSWAEGAPPIAAYTLVSIDANSLLATNVCSGSLLNALISSVTVIGGETYDNEKKLVQAGRTGWFTLACAGSAAAKMKLMGYSPQTKFPGTNKPSTVAQRQATLKMITAAYCENGVSYTENGTPVVWNNKAGTVDSSDWHVPGEIEAVWTDKGALCYDATRIADAEVDCILPSCDDFSVADGEWVTHVAVE